MDTRLVQQQTQKFILSPQIRQYLRLLQLPLNQLEQAVHAEMSENPTLEEVSQAPDDEPGNSDSLQSPSETSTKELRLEDSFNPYDQLDENFQESTSRDDIKDLQRRKNFQESLITRPEALSDFLLWQAGFLDLTKQEKEITTEIIGNIDEDGYLRIPLEEIAQLLHSTTSQVEKVLNQIHQLDPPGIGARNLQEALLLQLKRKGEEAAIAEKIVLNHLPLLEKRNWTELASILSVSPIEIKKAQSIISHLEPRPGRTFYVEEPLAVTPDAAILINDEEPGKYQIEIHDESLPELRINSYYRKLLRQKDLSPETRAFLQEKIQAAINFIKALSQRKSTLRQITEEIVRHQPEFLQKGFSHLRPLRLKDISAALNIHESTVSRAIHGKYISTPQGTIPYKSFFSTALETTLGESQSQKSIMERIRKLIEAESPQNPLSDQKIVKLLQDENIKIARRTVAKYREEMKLLPSHLRRSK